MPFLPSD
jgi:hypothetical protein